MMMYVALSKRLVTGQSHNSLACLRSVSPQHLQTQCVHVRKSIEHLFSTPAEFSRSQLQPLEFGLGGVCFCSLICQQEVDAQVFQISHLRPDVFKLLSTVHQFIDFSLPPTV